MSENIPTVSPATQVSVSALLKTDPAVTPEMMQAIISVLTHTPQQERLVSRKEAAHLINRSAKRVDDLCKRGVFKRVTFPGNSRSSGIKLSSVNRWLEGKEVR